MFRGVALGNMFGIIHRTFFLIINCNGAPVRAQECPRAPERRAEERAQLSFFMTSMHNNPYGLRACEGICFECLH